MEKWTIDDGRRHLCFASLEIENPLLFSIDRPSSGTNFCYSAFIIRSIGGSLLCYYVETKGRCDTYVNNEFKWILFVLQKNDPNPEEEEDGEVRDEPVRPQVRAFAILRWISAEQISF